MKQSSSRIAALAAAVFGMTAQTAVAAAHQTYQQTNLVSDGAVTAKVTDQNLQNSWGVAFFPGGPFWINDNATGLATVYLGDGTIVENTGQQFKVQIPGPNGSGSNFVAAPTGIVANTTGQFVLPKSKQSALFLFDTEDGTISGWSPADTGAAELLVDNSAVPSAGNGAVYKGLALGTNPQGNFLFATNFRAGTIDVYDSNFKRATLTGSFSDPKLPTGYAPFGIANIHGDLFVTYALQNTAKHDDVAGAGHGFVDVFDTSGNLISHFVSRGHLDSPWGIAAASLNFGSFSGDVLIGNFGDGKINAYDLESGAFDGQLMGSNKEPISIDGLWSLTFGGGAVSSPDALYFTAGPNGEKDGVFGTLTPQ
jgi:uncharacterized protein (TIGR03118 family)